MLITKSSGSEKHIGKTALVDAEVEALKPCFSNFTQRVRTNNKINPNFLHFILNSNLARVQYNYLSQTTTGLANLSSEIISDVVCPVFPIEEQKKIVKYLNHKTHLIDTLIEKKQKQIGLLKEQRATIINQAVTKGLNPNVKMKDSGIEWLGKVPEHWDISKLKYVTQVLRGKFSHRPRNDPAFYDGPFPFIQTGDVAKSSKYITGFTQTLNRKGYEISKEFPKGTLVMTIAANIGDIAILDFDACFPDSIVGFYPNEGISLDYLYYLLAVMRDEFYRVSTINTQLNINVDRISFCKCSIPSPKEQTEISKYLDEQMDKIELMKSTHQKTIEYLQEYRTTLISDVVTGKIDVRDEVINDSSNLP